MRRLILLILKASFFGIGCASYLRHSDVLASSQESQRNARSINRTGSVSQKSHADPQPLKLTMKSPNGMQYFTDITIGGQTLTGLYDTGSFDIITVSDLCAPCRVPPVLKRYTNSSSKTFEKGTRPVTGHWFAGGLLYARQDYDTLHLGAADSPISVKHMPFWQVVHSNMRLWTGNRSKFTTYVGLGHSKFVPVPKSQEPMKSLVELTGTKRFAICFQHEKGDLGYLTFHPTWNLNAAALAKTFRSVPVIGQVHWAVEMKSISFAGGGGSKCVDDQKCVVIIDSGTSLIGFGAKYYPYMKKLTEMIKEDCSNIGDLPDLVIELGAHKFALPASAYVIRSKWDKNYCYGAFMDFAMPSDKGDIWILGVPFLRHFYTVFDRSTSPPSVLIADADDNCEPVTPSLLFFHNASFTKKKQGLLPAIVDMSQASGPSWGDQKRLTV